MPPEDPLAARPEPDPHVVAALQEEAAKRLLAAASAHASAAPITVMDTKAIVTHTWFEALARAGFTEAQALYLVKEGT